MMAAPAQPGLPLPPMPRDEVVAAWLRAVLAGPGRPAATELVRALEAHAGLHARWHLRPAMETACAGAPTRDARAWLRDMLDSGALDAALHGAPGADQAAASAVDALLRAGVACRSSAAFREMVAFMGRFRAYSPYNNMLVRVQDPACSFYATQKDWLARFGRTPREDARPMLILAPMGPVLPVFSLDSTEGRDVPHHLLEFAAMDGPFQDRWAANLAAGAAALRIQVLHKPLSSTLGGYATTHRGAGAWLMRVAVHDGLEPAARFGVLCHELAHVLLGHLGGAPGARWPARGGLGKAAVEIEAEAVAHIVTARLGLAGRSAAYLAAYTPAAVEDGAVPPGVSLDTVAKVAGQIEAMALRAPKAKAAKKPRARAPGRAA